MWHSQNGLWVGEPSAILSARLRPLRMLSTRSSSDLVLSQYGMALLLLSAQPWKANGVLGGLGPGEGEGEGMGTGVPEHENPKTSMASLPPQVSLELAAQAIVHLVEATPARLSELPQ